MSENSGQTDRNVDKAVGGFLRGSTIGAIRLAAGACSLAYRTGAVIAKGATAAAKFGIDAYEANENAKRYDELIVTTKALNDELETSYSPRDVVALSAVDGFCGGFENAPNHRGMASELVAALNKIRDV